MPSDRSKNLRVWITGAVIGMFFLGLFVVAYQIGYNRGENNIAGKTPVPAPKTEDGDTSETGATSETASTGAGGETGETGGTTDPGAGKDAFAGSCGGCHTLAAAGTRGAAGPNLDDLKPDKTRVLNAITKGGTGGGAMPKDVVTGAEADEVAAFVDANAGQ